MREVYEEVARLTAQGEKVATATIVRTKGSTPREVGAKMLVRKTGISGTVGGGCGEADAWREALLAIDSNKTSVVVADLTEDIDLKSRGVCGGIFDILIEPWTSPVQVETVIKALDRPDRIAVLSVVQGRGFASTPSARLIVYSDAATEGTLGQDTLDRLVVNPARSALVKGKSETKTIDFEAKSANGATVTARAEVFFEVFVPAPTLIVCGAGHIAVPLATFAKELGFTVVVLDDRASFARAERFPTADRVIVGGFESELAKMPVHADTYIVLVTRGHSFDVEALRSVIRNDPAYIGMIGSKRRVWAVFKLLHDEGISIEDIKKVYAPIGLDLAAETPAEIALTIAAEMVKIRRGGKAPSLSDELRERYAKLLAEGKELG